MSNSSMVYASSIAGTPATGQQKEKVSQESKPTIPLIRIDTASDHMLQPVESNIPIISITSPQVVIETKTPSQSLVCVADPQVASGVIIQPEHGIEDDPTTVVARGKFKEHLLKQDPATDASLPIEAKEHSIESDMSQKEPKPVREHDIVECNDGTTSPPPGLAQDKITLFAVQEISEHASSSVASSGIEDNESKLPSAMEVALLSTVRQGGGTGEAGI
ncbi:hypothetical protein IF1G_09348 [Cordyceps javanica]|uniref:Uncharacterized protein n=1 Tax=Cordyceps javanica TaxID=43265 RepID=A0A545UQM7_9HYPO|nr:hypothetical protein IF1G_09348 [Cordyceps javanica]